MQHLLHTALCALLTTISATAEDTQTPAQKQIAAAQQAVTAKPDLAATYAPLAFAHAARARETADGENYTRAMQAIDKGLALEPDHFNLLKAKAWVLLGQHEFQEALTLVRKLGERNGDDPQLWSMRADAAIETGHYKEAEEAAQWALDVDPGGTPGLTRAAYLREHFGDFDGAIQLMQQSLDRTRPSDTEDRAWLLTHIGHLYLLKNEPDTAAKAHEAALEAFPGYHYALLNLAHTRSAQGKHKEALELHRQHYAAAAHPENLYELALGMKHAGKVEEAKKAFAEFEQGALGESKNVDNANRELTAYYVDIAGKPKEALRIAEIEMANRQDYRTTHAYAWALHANGSFKKAHEQMQKTLSIGVKEPIMQYHAGIIARDGGDVSTARKHLQASLTQAPKSRVATKAKAALEKLD